LGSNHTLAVEDEKLDAPQREQLYQLFALFSR